MQMVLGTIGILLAVVGCAFVAIAIELWKRNNKIYVNGKNKTSNKEKVHRNT